MRAAIFQGKGQIVVEDDPSRQSSSQQTPSFELDLSTGQVTSKPCTIRAGAFHPDEANRSIRTQPPHQLLTPGLGGVGGFDAQHPPR